MKLVTYLHEGEYQLAILVNGTLYDMDALHAGLPATMKGFLQNWEDNYPVALECEAALFRGYRGIKGRALGSVKLLSPVPHANSLRDGYAFRRHVETSRQNRGLPMIPEFNQYPVFYFGNHRTITGPGDIALMPDHFRQLDYELECSVVICKEGMNINAEEADQYIAGLMIMNDWSARTLQMEEMLLNLGPAKGKDFATSFGPWLVTADELVAYKIAGKTGHTGNTWNLKMSAIVNGRRLSEGNLAEMEWTFAELIERASYGVTLYPGDIIGSGTVGTGCLLEINGTRKSKHSDAIPQWLYPGDRVELEIEHLGRLSNRVNCMDSKYSILQKKNKADLYA